MYPLTPSARRHIRLFLGALRPYSRDLNRRFTKNLLDRAYDARQVRAFLAITPSAAAALRRLPQFFEQVDYSARRLAKLNIPAAEVIERLDDFDALVSTSLSTRSGPAREQLQIATTLAVNASFYEVRESEAQAFFSLYRAETESRSLDDLLNRFVRTLAQTFHAPVARLILDRPPSGCLARPLYIRHGSRREALIADPKMRGRYASYWSYPLRSAGLIQLGFRCEYPWLPRELALLEAMAERCNAAIRRARLEQDNRRLEAQARSAEEDERRRIGRELHDDAGQSLLFLRLQLEMMERNAPESVRPRLAEACQVTERVISDLRRIIAALSPAALERLGLERALHQLAARFRSVYPARIRISIPALRRPIPRQIQEVIYRVAQESLQNIAKHSQATHIKLFLRSTDKYIRLSVSDNGVGFRPEATANRSASYGLTGMRERAALFGGTLTVRSAPNAGASIVLEIPCGAGTRACSVDTRVDGPI